MFKTFLLTFLLAASAASSLADPLIVDKAKKQFPIIVQKCTPNCVILDEADTASLQSKIRAMLQQAYEAGIAEGIRKEKSTL